MEPRGPVISEQDLTMFKQTMAIVMLQEMNRTIEDIDKVFGYELYEYGDGPVYCDKDGLYISSNRRSVSKISSWNVRDYWTKFIDSSTVYFCTSNKQPIENFQIFLPSSCYYFSSLPGNVAHLMDSGDHFDMDKMNIPRQTKVHTMNLSAPAESYFQNSTLQGDYGQWFSVWRLYVDSFCKYHNINDLHFYSVFHHDDVRDMYNLIPKGMWTTMAEMHHELFMKEFASVLI